LEVVKYLVEEHHVKVGNISSYSKNIQAYLLTKTQ